MSENTPAYLTLTMGEDQPVWGREELATVLALIEAREMGKWAVYAFAAHLARSLGETLDEVDRLRAAAEMAAAEIEEYGGCDCCSGCGFDGDGWNEPACTCECDRECWQHVADELRRALTGPDQEADRG